MMSSGFYLINKLCVTNKNVFDHQPFGKIFCVYTFIFVKVDQMYDEHARVNHYYSISYVCDILHSFLFSIRFLYTYKYNTYAPQYVIL